MAPATPQALNLLDDLDFLSLRAMDTAVDVMPGAKRIGYKGPADYIRALETFKKEVG